MIARTGTNSALPELKLRYLRAAGNCDIYDQFNPAAMDTQLRLARHAHHIGGADLDHFGQLDFLHKKSGDRGR